MPFVLKWLSVTFLVATVVSASVSRSDEDADATGKLERLLKAASLQYREGDLFFIVPLKMPTGYVQDVFVSKRAHVFGDVPFIEITAIGWRWQDATEFNRQNANLLLKASSRTKIGAWQALVFEDDDAIAAEFKATLPLDITSKTLAATIRGVGSSAFELHDIMDR